MYAEVGAVDGRSEAGIANLGVHEALVLNLNKIARMVETPLKLEEISELLIEMSRLVTKRGYEM